MSWTCAQSLWERTPTKSKTGNMLSSDNYRGITVCSIFSKLFELRVFDKIEKKFVTNVNSLVLKRVLVVLMLYILCKML